MQRKKQTVHSKPNKQDYEYTDWYLTALGKWYVSQENFKEAFSCGLKSVSISAACDSGSPHYDSDGDCCDLGSEGNLEIFKAIFSNQIALSEVSKSDVFLAIKHFPDNEKIKLLRTCLIKGTILGNRLWKTEFPWTGCSYEKGTLKKICEYLKKIDPTFVTPIAPITKETIFKDRFNYKNAPTLNLDDLQEERNHGYGL